MIRLSDDCNATPGRKPVSRDVEAAGHVVLRGDTLTVGDVVLRRVEPVGFGDVHWEYVGTELRFTTVEVAP